LIVAVPEIGRGALACLDRVGHHRLTRLKRHQPLVLLRHHCLRVNLFKK